MGCVYILSNPAMPGLIKIGFTKRTAEERAEELYNETKGIPARFVVVHTKDCEEPETLEKRAHTRLAEHRINTRREFFRYPADEAYELLQNLYRQSQEKSKLFSIWGKIKPFLEGIKPEFTWKWFIKNAVFTIFWNTVVKPIWGIIWKIFSSIEKNPPAPYS